MTVEIEVKVLELLFVAVCLTVIFITVSILLAQHFVPLILCKLFHKREGRDLQE